MTAWAQLYSGRRLDIRAPVVDREMILVDVATHLARINRFCGGTRLPYSVAQHSVVGAECVMAETGDAELAAFFLLHDGHEFVLGDETTPANESLFEEIDWGAESNGVGVLARQAMAARIKRARVERQRRIDKAIVEAAGLNFPRFEAASETILSYDLRSAKSERNDLMHRPPSPWRAAVEQAPRLKTHGDIRPWTWIDAEDRFRGAFERLCPEKSSATPVSPSHGAALSGTPRTAA